MDPKTAGAMEGLGRGELPAAGDVSGDWLIDALTESSDLVFAFDASTTITWCNPACLRILGFSPDEVIGNSIATFIHPDDVERAAEVVGLSAAGAFDEMPVTPALYRARRADGTWVNLDLNGSTGPDGSMLIVARVGGDLVLNDRLLEAVSGNEPFEQQVALVMEMGMWRHPREGYAILYRGEDDERCALNWNLTPELYGAEEIEGPTPWDVAMATDREVAVADLATASGSDAVASAALVNAAGAAGFLGCLVAPIADPDHPGSACIVVWTTAKGPTTSGHRYAMGNMKRALTLVLQQRSQVRALERAARVDSLTGTASRAWFMELLGDLADAPGGTRHALLYIDLDGFKGVNDHLGHAAGDQVLTETARRITEAAPPGATIARLGGDEFAVLCASGTEVAHASAAAQQIIDAVARPIAVGRGHATVGASIGLAIGHPGEAPTSVLDAADGALLSAKASGRGCWTLAGPRSER
ncbi:diguanylate cyclase domain-containing protein [Aquihabitans daechungensis]|uniref:diguanylate cyclase domain-containing protein n=1 Tax=Aquihabitans daechungensis TaxID=1052257 RepID=UPI003BA3B105